MLPMAQYPNIWRLRGPAPPPAGPCPQDTPCSRAENCRYLCAFSTRSPAPSSHWRGTARKAGRSPPPSARPTRPAPAAPSHRRRTRSWPWCRPQTPPPRPRGARACLRHTGPPPHRGRSPPRASRPSSAPRRAHRARPWVTAPPSWRQAARVPSAARATPRAPARPRSPV